MICNNFETFFDSSPAVIKIRKMALERNADEITADNLYARELESIRAELFEEWKSKNSISKIQN
jgi:hypothetical protein